MGPERRVGESTLPSRHRFKDNSLKVFRLGNAHDNGVIQRLSNAMNESHVPAGIMETLRDRSFEFMAGDVVGAGKCGENAVF